MPIRDDLHLAIQAGAVPDINDSLHESFPFASICLEWVGGGLQWSLAGKPVRYQRQGERAKGKDDAETRRHGDAARERGRWDSTLSGRPIVPSPRRVFIVC